MVERSIALFGTTSPVPERTVLNAGPVTATLEAGNLRWLRIGDREVIRMIAFLIRDTGWSTAIPEISKLDVEQRKDGFKVTLVAHCKTVDGAIDWSGTITGDSDGRIVFDAAATPKQDFETNRTGFIVLHPLQGVVGEPVHVTYVDGHEEDSFFPDLIDPYQSFKGVRALANEVLPGLRAACTMEGDAWEMEDHRNWTDASYKTYVRLLEWGYPYEIKGGETVRQTITVAFTGDRPAAGAAAEPQPVAISLGAAGPEKLPGIGVSLPRVRFEEAKAAAPLLGGEASPAFLHCRIAPGEGESSDLLAAYKAVAEAIGSPIALEVMVTSGASARDEIAAAKSSLAEAGIEPIAISVVPAPAIIQFDPTDIKDEEAIAAIPKLAREAFGNTVSLGGGVFGFFTELNRNRPPFDLIDFVTHMSGSIIHAADDESVMENLESFAHIIRSARHISGGKPHWLGPSNIAMDTNPYGNLLENPDNIRTTMVRMDPRQRGTYAAAWTVGLVAEAVRGGVANLTTSAPVGELGMVYAHTDYAQPHFDDNDAAKVYPVYHVMRGALHGSGQRNLRVATSDAARIRAYGYEREGERHLWLANMTGTRQEAEIPDEIARGARVSVIDADTFGQATADPQYLAAGARLLDTARLVLDAYAAVRIVSKG